MKAKISLYIVLTMIALLGSLGIAAAQSTPPAPPVEITPQLHSARTRNGTVIEGAGISTTAASTNEMAAPQVIGWNYIHPAYCVSYWDGTNY